MHSYCRFIFIQVNEKIQKGHIGIVEKAQETSSDSDMHNTVCLCHCCTSRTVDVSWNAEKHPHHR